MTVFSILNSTSALSTQMVAAATIPPLVHQHHAAFLNALEERLPQARYLSDDDVTALQRSVQAARVAEDGPTRHLKTWEVADTLWLAFGAALPAWSAQCHQRPGNQIETQYYGAERLFEPPGDMIWNVPRSSYGRAADAATISGQLEGLHPQANRVLELRNRRFLQNAGLEFTEWGASACVFFQYGVYLFFHGDDQHGFRLPALSLWQRVYNYCLGEQSLQFCFVPPEISGAQVNELRLYGYTPVSLVNHPTLDPWRSLSYGMHDFRHASQVVVYAPPAIQWASYAFARACQNLLDEGSLEAALRQKLDKVVDGIAETHFLRCGFKTFFPPVQEVMAMISADTARRRFLNDYLEILETHYGPRSTPELIAHRTAVAAL